MQAIDAVTVVGEGDGEGDAQGRQDPGDVAGDVDVPHVDEGLGVVEGDDGAVGQVDPEPHPGHGHVGDIRQTGVRAVLGEGEAPADLTRQVEHHHSPAAAGEEAVGRARHQDRDGLRPQEESVEGLGLLPASLPLSEDDETPSLQADPHLAAVLDEAGDVPGHHQPPQLAAALRLRGGVEENPPVVSGHHDELLRAGDEDDGHHPAAAERDGAQLLQADLLAALGRVDPQVRSLEVTLSMA